MSTSEYQGLSEKLIYLKIVILYFTLATYFTYTLSVTMSLRASGSDRTVVCQFLEYILTCLFVVL